MVGRRGMDCQVVCRGVSSSFLEGQKAERDVVST